MRASGKKEEESQCAEIGISGVALWCIVAWRHVHVSARAEPTAHRMLRGSGERKLLLAHKSAVHAHLIHSMIIQTNTSAKFGHQP